MEVRKRCEWCFVESDWWCIVSYGIILEIQVKDLHVPSLVTKAWPIGCLFNQLRLGKFWSCLFNHAIRLSVPASNSVAQLAFVRATTSNTRMHGIFIPSLTCNSSRSEHCAIDDQEPSDQHAGGAMALLTSPHSSYPAWLFSQGAGPTRVKAF